jgi:hypothetical protein
MALKLSTKLRTALLSGHDLRSIFDDCVIQIWGETTTIPSTADAATTGSLLVTITKSGASVTAGEVSIAQESTFVVTSHGISEIWNFKINGNSYSYDNSIDAGDATAVAAKIAEVFNRSGEPVWASTGGTATIYIRSSIRGLAFTFTFESSTGTGTGPSTPIANSTADTLRFGAAVDGSISKDASIWTGKAALTGTARYFRIVTSSDTGVDDTINKLFPRLQGTVGTTAADMIVTSPTITKDSDQTIDAASLTLPASA